MILALPETARSISGDGSIPGRTWHKAPLKYLLKKNQPNPQRTSSLTPRKPTSIPNPLRSLALLFYPDTAPVILINSITYTTYCCLQVSLSSLFIDLYHFTELKAGLIYIPFGIGCLLSSFLSGKLMTSDYRRTAARHGIGVDLVRKTDLSNFPIEAARFRSMPLIIITTTMAMAGYGWVLQSRVVGLPPATLPNISI
jgi:predicted MFS family arabinose efflux permease